MTPCSLVDKYKHFGETCYRQLKGKNNTLWEDAEYLSETFVYVQQNAGCHVPAQSYLHTLLTSNSAFLLSKPFCVRRSDKRNVKCECAEFHHKVKKHSIKQSQYKAYLAVHRTSGLKGNETNTEPVFPSLALWQNIYLSTYNALHITTLSG